MNYCETKEIIAILLLIKYALNIIKIVVPILLIVLASFDLAKMMFDPDKADYKIILNRFANAVIIFLVPTLVMLFLNVLGSVVPSDTKSNFFTCFVNLDDAKLESAKAKDDAKREKYKNKVKDNNEQALKKENAERLKKNVKAAEYTTSYDKYNNMTESSLKSELAKEKKNYNDAKNRYEEYKDSSSEKATLAKKEMDSASKNIDNINKVLKEKEDKRKVEEDREKLKKEGTKEDELPNTENINYDNKVSKTIQFDPNDLTVVSNLTVDELRSALKTYAGGKEIAAGKAPALIKAEKTYGVNALGLLGIQAFESAWYGSKIAKECNNYGGVCHTSGTTACHVSNSNCTFRKYKNSEDFIMSHAKMLKNSYLTPGGVYYNGKSLSAISKRYLGPSDNASQWVSGISSVGNGVLKEAKKYRR